MIGREYPEEIFQSIGEATLNVCDITKTYLRHNYEVSVNLKRQKVSNAPKQKQQNIRKELGVLNEGNGFTVDISGISRNLNNKTFGV